jgi:predicted nucleic acid-binding protein
MIVVSDASVLILLSKVGQLALLQALYDRVLLPQQVYDDVVVKGSGRPGAAEVQAALWLEIWQVANLTLVRELEREIDPGEAEAIALALESHADLLLIDERRGRTVAARYGLNITGVAGILLDAKDSKLLPSVQPTLNLLTGAGYRISDQLYRQILLTAGE